MILSFPPATLAKLARIEAAEGMPPEETVHQAVEVWVRLSPKDRSALVEIMARGGASRH